MSRTDNALIITENLGGTHHFEDQDVSIIGNILPGAKIALKDGNLTVHGNVGAESNILIGNGAATIEGNVNDRAGILQIVPDKAAAEPRAYGINIKGTVGHNCDLYADDAIIAGSVGTESLPEGKSARSTLTSPKDITVTTLGEGMALHAGGDAEVTRIGSRSVVKASGSVRFDEAGDGVFLTAAKEITGEKIGENAGLQAGGAISITSCPDSAHISAENPNIAQLPKPKMDWRTAIMAQQQAAQRTSGRSR